MSKLATIKPNSKTKTTTKQSSSIKSTLQTSNNFYYGERTAKAFATYNIGEELMPTSVIKAIGILKKAATLANEELKLLSKDKTVKIIKSIDEVITGKLDEHFPLKVWQIGSGMHSNMNANEVIANRALDLIGGKKLNNNFIDPVEDINKSQSSNDAFSIAIHIAAALSIKNDLLPAAKKLRNAFEAKSKEFANIVKVGRTHSMDSFLLTFGEEFAAYVNQLDNDIERMEYGLKELYDLALGTMIVGTDRVIIHKEFPNKVAKQLQKLTKLPFKVAKNKLATLSSKNALVFTHSTMKLFASTLFKIANDIRILASGPRCGIAELILPEADTADPIMPGKNNPIPSEIVAMVTAQVFGNDTTIEFAGANGHLELNVYMPVIIYNFLQTSNLLANTCSMFEKLCVKGIKINRTMNTAHIYNTLVTIKELVPQIGNENSTNIANLAIKENISIKDAAIKLGLIDADEFDRITSPKKYLKNKK
jgi:fumarate hydratase class II